MRQQDTNNLIVSPIVVSLYGQVEGCIPVLVHRVRVHRRKPRTGRVEKQSNPFQIPVLHANRQGRANAPYNRRVDVVVLVALEQHLQDMNVHFSASMLP